jgi:hypothetical protein
MGLAGAALAIPAQWQANSAAARARNKVILIRQILKKRSISGPAA